jgi:hypothetical protein
LAIVDSIDDAIADRHSLIRQFGSAIDNPSINQSTIDDPSIINRQPSIVIR